jgi:predicted ATP-grasp superfamily ATP-dependent carboligase
MKGLKFKKVNRKEAEEFQFAPSGIIVKDSAGCQYRIYCDNLGRLVINASDGSISITPQVSNEILIKTNQ